MNRLGSSSCCSSEVNADLYSAGDGDGSDFFDLRRGALKVDVTLVDCHFPVVPGLWALTTRTSSAADAQVFIRETNGARNFDVLGFGVANKLVGDLLHGVESVSAESDAGALDFLVFNAFLFSVFISHRIFLIFMDNQI